MSIIKCPECGKEISDKATACPNCGCPKSEFFSQDIEEKPSFSGFVRELPPEERPEMMECYGCGKKIPVDITKCPFCEYDYKSRNESEVLFAGKREFAGLRLALAIIMIVISVFIAFQSFIVIFSLDSDAASIGFLLSMAMMVSGILAIITRKSRNYMFCTGIAATLLILGFTAYRLQTNVYEDLKIWGIVSVIFGFVFGFSGLAIRKNNSK